MKKEITAHQFPDVYKKLGINVNKLGCVMLDLKPPAGIPTMKKRLETDDALYTSPSKERFWIKGWVFSEPHITLLYGLITPAFESPMKDLVPEVLEGWKRPDAEIDHVGFFESTMTDEPYYCLIAHIVKTPELLEGNGRMRLLPHVDTFPEYKPHATIAYIKKSKGEQYRDDIISVLNDNLKGKKLPFSKLNLGSNGDS